jgi:hypothetical protein
MNLNNFKRLRIKKVIFKDPKNLENILKFLSKKVILKKELQNFIN